MDITVGQTTVSFVNHHGDEVYLSIELWDELRQYFLAGVTAEAAADAATVDLLAQLEREKESLQRRFDAEQIRHNAAVSTYKEILGDLVYELKGERMTDTPVLLDGAAIKAAIQARSAAAAEAEVVQVQQAYQYVRPFSTAADGFIEFVQNPEGRFMLGLQDVDAKTRGFGKGELIYITGRAHSGKTQVVMNALASHPSSKVLFFTPDEPAELILAKLVALRHGINSEQVEERIKAKDQYTVDLVRSTAAETFRNLVVIDDSLTLGQMKVAVEEARDFWSADADAVVIDFLELIPGEGDANGVAQKSQDLKRWTKDVDLPVLCLHQASRSSGNRGQAAGMGAMRYGGETEAIFVLEVFRRREDPELTEWERDHLHRNTVTINVAKNKRPPCHVGEVDYYMDPNTGLIRPLQAGDQAVAPPTDRVAQMLQGRAA